VESVRRTGRLATVHEAWVEGGFGAEIVASVAERVTLRTRVVRVGAAPVPIPSGKLRRYALPEVDRLVDALRKHLAE
jgi:pyruvate dehydrogenase E1 component beta subunit